MKDQFGRRVEYLRVSVTDKCNLRCVYCMPLEGLPWLKREEILSYEEIERVVRTMAGMGLKRVRITGGEPLVRRDLPDLIRVANTHLESMFLPIVTVISRKIFRWSSGFFMKCSISIIEERKNISHS